MYVAKIPGTKYLTSLESQGGQWFLRLKLDGVVEAEEDLDQLNRRNIQNHLRDLFKQISLQINSFQIDLILKELLVQVEHLLLQEQTMMSSKEKLEATNSPKYDPRVDLLYNRIEELETLVQTLTDRVERMELFAKN